MKESHEKWDLGDLQEGCKTGSPVSSESSGTLSSCGHEPKLLPSQWSPAASALTHREGGGVPGLGGGRASPHEEGTRLDAPS